jgi:hypothetical protein
MSMYSPEDRYERYKAYCRLVGSPPMEFERWVRFADALKIGYLECHQPSGDRLIQ